MVEKSEQASRSSAKRSRADLWFLGATLVGFGVVALVDAGYARQAAVAFWEMAKTLLPALVLVFILLSLFNLIQGIQKKLKGITGANSGLKGWWVAIIGGILSHGPVYAWYPLLGELKQQGARPALLATFLYARSIKLPWLPVMVHYFGLPYTVVFSFYIVVFSVVNGYLTAWLLPHSEIKQAAGGASPDE